MLLIDEHFRPDGSLVRTHIDSDGDHVRVIADDGVHGHLSVAALDKVLQRYGRPFDEAIEVSGPALEFAGDHVLTHLRWRAPVDAAPRDWLVWSGGGREPVVALATSIAAVLRYLVLRLTGEAEAGGDVSTPSGEPDPH